MDKGGGRSIIRCSIMILCFLFLLVKIHAARSLPHSHQAPSPGVKLHVTDKYVDIDNGIIAIKLSNPSGMITSLAYKGVRNILEFRKKEGARGYWDIVWSRPDGNDSHFDTLMCTSFKVVSESYNQVEVSFAKTWDPSLDEDLEVPLNIDKRYIIRQGESGFYSYATFEHLEGWPNLNIDETRITFKLLPDMFHYMVISDDKQSIMPSDDDRKKGRMLDYQEAVLLINPSNPKLRGEVDDKYMYSCDNKDNHVHGWISSDPRIGFWVVIPSDEFRTGGPTKQDLTSHAGSTSLVIFFSGHYAGKDYGVRLRNGEEWKKVYGPVFIYLNSGSTQNTMWEDAKRQTIEETKKWPYNFISSRDFPHAHQRGAVSGRLLVEEMYASSYAAQTTAYVGLAPPGDVGSWQENTKGYQFWNKTNEGGFFTIVGVRPGTYSLYAWVSGVIGDFKYHTDIVIEQGHHLQIGQVVYNPPRNGPTIWEIGIPDRTAAEFYIPDPSDGLANKLFINHTEKYRQYGLWTRYTDMYPDQDLVYNIGVSNYRTDWYFAQVNRRVDGNYVPTTWKILFNARNVVTTGTYTLRLAVASANFAEVQVFINTQNGSVPHFSTGIIGKDNAIARHGIHGLYKLCSVNISGLQLVEGTNILYLRQARGGYPFTGIMYDYIRLEGPPN